MLERTPGSRLTGRDPDGPRIGERSRGNVGARLSFGRFAVARANPRSLERVGVGLAIAGLVLVALVAGGELSARAGLLVFGVMTGLAALGASAVRTTSAVSVRADDGVVDAAPAPDRVNQGSLASEASTAAATVIDRGHAILAAIPDAALIVDRAGLIVETNPLVADMFPRGRPGLLVNQMCRSPEVVDAVERALMIGRVVVEIEEWVPVRRKLMMTVVALDPTQGAKRVDTPADQPRLHDTRATPATANSSTLPTVLLIVFRDVSEQEKLAQMRADFIANASHELRTPLASLRGFVETLQGPARDDPVARDRFLAIMATQANRMTRLIDDLLSLSRVEMRVHVPPTGIVDLGDVAQSVVHAMEPLAAGYQARVTMVPLDVPARIRGERDELVQVVQNLVHNALKYGRPTGGSITLRLGRQPTAHADRHRITLEVEDDGPGIATSHLPRLTERFYRVSPTVSRDRGGTGLGLAIVKNIVTRHRGELEIRSETGRGSVFSVTFDESTDKSKT